MKIFSVLDWEERHPEGGSCPERMSLEDYPRGNSEVVDNYLARYLEEDIVRLKEGFDLSALRRIMLSCVRYGRVEESVFSRDWLYQAGYYDCREKYQERIANWERLGLLSPEAVGSALDVEEEVLKKC